jgi:predicted  nucleic acid-binding Zn-ribbon protein
MNAAALLALQDIDTALAAIANRRPRLPELAAQRAAAAAVAGHHSAMAAVRQRIADAETAIETAEHAATAITTKRARLEAQLKTVIAPREAEALMSQIATLNAQRGELDDQELEALDAQATAEGELGELMMRSPDLEAALEAAELELQRATGELAAEETALLERRPAATAGLSAAEIAAYDTARRHHDGVAIARLEGRRCQGCHLDLSAAEMDTVKATPEGTLPECPQCGRFLAR